jgi:hypothetical protein
MVEIRQVPVGGRLDDFLDVVDYIYRDDTAYVRPLDMMVKDQLHPRKNPFFEHGEAVVFCAYRNGRVVGRCTASIDREHLARHQDGTGFFGFLDTVDDERVVGELLASAEAWLRARGIERARGPLSLNINEELGCLVSGFETPPFIMMPHHRPYQSKLIETAGYAKVKDFYAWRYAVGDLNARVKRAHEDVKALPEVSYRRASLKNLESDVEIFVDVFNDAWSDNWGFVPLSRSEARKMVSDFRLLLIPEITSIVSIHGEPAAVALAIPNLNEVVSDFGGKLFPKGLPKLVWRLKVRGPHSARLILLGIRKKWRLNRRYAPLSAFMYAEMNNGGREVGIERGELGWTLEDNGRVNAGIMTMGARVYKTYRVYEKALKGGAA